MIEGHSLLGKSEPLSQKSAMLETIQVFNYSRDSSHSNRKKLWMEE